MKASILLSQIQYCYSYFYLQYESEQNEIPASLGYEHAHVCARGKLQMTVL